MFIDIWLWGILPFWLFFGIHSEQKAGLNWKYAGTANKVCATFILAIIWPVLVGALLLWKIFK